MAKTKQSNWQPLREIHPGFRMGKYLDLSSPDWPVGSAVGSEVVCSDL